MSSLALISGWYYICTSYCTPDTLIQKEKIVSVSCYESRLKELSQETTLVLSNTRELDRVPTTK